MGSALEVLNSGAIHTLEQAKIDAARITQKGRNTLKAATAGAGAWMQSVNNQKRLKAAGQ